MKLIIAFISLVIFEILNFSATQYALNDIFPSIALAGAIFFCGIDIVGLIRIFAQEKGDEEPAAVWYMFGGWFLLAAFNAILVWWGISVAILNNSPAFADMKSLPILVAAGTLIIRVLIINGVSIAGERAFSRQ